MKLCELSDGYQEAAKLISQRLSQLRKELKLEDDPQKRAAVRNRISFYSEILTQCYDLRELTARYYERSYKRNDKYTL